MYSASEVIYVKTLGGLEVIYVKTLAGHPAHVARRTCKSEVGYVKTLGPEVVYVKTLGTYPHALNIAFGVCTFGDANLG